MQVLKISSARWLAGSVTPPTENDELAGLYRIGDPLLASWKDERPNKQLLVSLHRQKKNYLFLDLFHERPTDKQHAASFCYYRFAVARKNYEFTRFSWDFFTFLE